MFHQEYTVLCNDVFKVVIGSIIKQFGWVRRQCRPELNNLLEDLNF